MTDILFVMPPGLGEMVSHHEATSGMGALVPAAAGLGAPGFLYPPQTVAGCVAAARAAGATTTVLDGAHSRTPEAFARDVAQRPCGILAVLVSQGSALADANFLRLLRQARGRTQGPPVLLLGPSAHFAAEPLLAEGLADAVLLGEPEGAFAEAARGAAAGVLSGMVPAAGLRPDRYGASGLLADLDLLPFPAWEHVPWQPYSDVSLLSSRGCPDGCTYCAYAVAQGAHARTQTAERTLAELTWLAEKIPARRIQVRDPVFARDRARAAAICEGLLARRIRVKFNCESRPEHFDDELLRLLAAAGCWRVKVGLESGDPTLLVGLGRVRDASAAERYIAETVRVARTSAALALRCQVFVMAGLPGQDAASLARTEAVLQRLPPATQILAKPYQPHPGTGLAAPAAAVPTDLLARLAQGNRVEPRGARRVWLLLRGRAEERRGGGAEERQEGEAESHAGSNDLSRSARPDTTEVATTNGPSDRTAQALQPGLAGEQVPQDAFRWPETQVFLTGGSGFLGGHIARTLVAAGAQVTALVRPGSPLGALAELPVSILRGDLTRPSEWLGALRECQICFHAAALYASGDRTAELNAVNVTATSALLAACATAGVVRVVHTSTIGTVGRRGGQALPDETTPFNLWDQASAYVRTKYLGEQVALTWNGAGLQVVIVKPTAPVGAGDAHPSATGRRILAALRGQITPYPPLGVNHAPVADIAAGHLLAAQRGQPGRVYILGHRDGNLDHATFLRLVAETAGIPMPQLPRRPAAAESLPAALTANPARAIQELGMPQGNLRAAFAESVTWFRAAGRA